MLSALDVEETRHSRHSNFRLLTLLGLQPRDELYCYCSGILLVFKLIGPPERRGPSMYYLADLAANKTQLYLTMANYHGLVRHSNLINKGDYCHADNCAASTRF